MKKLIRLFVFTALIATFALPALGQSTPAATPATTPAAAQDDTQAKTELYERFTKDRNANPQAAYEAGKEYLAKYEAKDGPDDQYIKYIKKWVAAYDKIARKNQFSAHIKGKNYNDAFAIGKQILAEEPEDLGVLFELSRAGLTAAESGNKAFNADTIVYAKKTMQLLQAGRTFEKDKPVANKDEIMGGLNYVVGFLLQETQPAEATNYLVNAAQFEGFAKKDPRTYLFLADIYEKGEYAKLANQFNNSCKTAEQLATAECTALKAKADQVVDHMIDALARAIAYSNSSPNAAAQATQRAAWTESLTNYYKYRNNGSDTGLKELIAGITSKPLPKPGEAMSPLTPSAPASTSTPTTSPSGTSSTAPSGTSTTTKPAATTPASGKAAATQPATKASSTKTTPKRAHASGKRG
jgi:hypothetical protein